MVRPDEIRIEMTLLKRVRVAPIVKKKNMVENRFRLFGFVERTHVYTGVRNVD